MKPTFFHKLDDFDDFVVILTKNMVSKAVQEITMFFSKWINSKMKEPKVSDKISPHKANLYFLMRNDPYFHVGYAPKINFGSTHNIKVTGKYESRRSLI